ncbi:MAG: choice-of-anchor X domain-containing protein [Vicinamibacteria bacterium]
MVVLKAGRHTARIAIEILLPALVMTAPRIVTGQETVGTIALLAAQFELDRLAPGETSGEAVFVIDEADSVTLEIIAIEGLVTSIEGPASEVLDQNTIGAFSGEFASFEGAEQARDPFVLPTSIPGFHYLYTFPSLGPGNYTVRFRADSALIEEVPVITQLFTDSQVGTSLFATESVLKLGNPAVLTAALFEGDQPVLDANIDVVIRPEVGSPVTLTLLDDGGDADNASEDGLYSAEFVPDLPGLYRVAAEIRGITRAGLPFFREPGSQFTVVAPASLTGRVEDRGVDDDGDLLFDRMVVDVEANTTAAGNYRVFVHLKTRGGQKLVRSAGAELSVGVQTVAVDFEAIGLQESGEDGPYNVELVELLLLGEEGAIPSDRLVDVGETNPYRLADFEGFVERSVVCDVDLDEDIDINDITAIVAARGQHAEPGDPRDADGDGTITITDARSCVLQCSNLRCVP